MLQCMLTNIVDLDSIRIHPDELDGWDEAVQAAVKDIRSFGCLPRPLVVFKGKGYDEYFLHPSENNIICFLAIDSLSKKNEHPDRVTVFVAPNGRAAKVAESFFC